MQITSFTEAIGIGNVPISFLIRDDARLLRCLGFFCVLSR